MTRFNLETRDAITKDLSPRVAFMIRMVRRIFVILKSRNIRMKDTLPPRKPLGTQTSIAACLGELSTVSTLSSRRSRKIHGSKPLGEDLPPT